jgi:hypothetical protein
MERGPNDSAMERPTWGVTKETDRMEKVNIIGPMEITIRVFSPTGYATGKATSDREKLEYNIEASTTMTKSAALGTLTTERNSFTVEISKTTSGTAMENFLKTGS